MRTIERLKDLNVRRLKTPGMYSDGGGLYLQITGAGAKSWIFRFSLRGRAREMGLGSAATVSLSDARSKAAECRALREDGIDPIEARARRRSEAAVASAKTVTFKSAAEQYIASQRAGWRNVKHAAQWEATLAAYAEPVLGKVGVQDIDTSLLLKVLEPIWTTKPETASRVRGRIEIILNWATAHGYRFGDNPARWRGHLKNLLPAPSKVRRVKHHPALAFDAVSAFIADLKVQDGVAARALEFTILTVARTGETIGAEWTEINTAVWTVPGERMKAGKEHRVPLAPRAAEILDHMRNMGVKEKAVFPGGRPGKPLSNMAMTQVLRRMGRDDITVHGFRSTFRDWAAERTNFPREVAEMALAHAIGDEVEAAYRRGDLFDKRRRLMHAWSEFCSRTAVNSTVVPLRA